MICLHRFSVRPVHLWLLSNPPNKLHFKICRRHHSGWMRLWQGWDGEQGRGGGTVSLVLRQQLIMDFRKHRQDYTPLPINGEHVETVTTFSFLDTHASADHSWTFNIRALVKKAQQWLHFLHVLRKNNLDTKLLLAFYHSSVESVLMHCLNVWYTGSSAEDKKAVQRVINTAKKIICCPLPSLENISILLPQENQGFFPWAIRIANTHRHPPTHMNSFP